MVHIYYTRTSLNSIEATSFISQPKRPNGSSKGTPEVDFWSQDMANLLSADVKLRQELGKYFDKNEGSEGT